MELLLLYFWLKLDFVINGLVITGGVIIGVMLIALFIRAYRNDDSQYSWSVHKKLPYSTTKWKTLLVIGVSFLSVGNLIPNKTDVAILIGAHYAIKVSETPEAAKVMTLMRKKANEILDKELAK